MTYSTRTLSPTLSQKCLVLTRKEARAATRHLETALGAIVAGNSTEARYNVGQEFDGGSLADGSVVIMEQESLCYHELQNYDRLGLRGLPDEQTPPLRRPYSQHWLSNQTGVIYGAGQHKAGSLHIAFPERSTRYCKALSWGVLLRSAENTRVLAPFSFSRTHLEHNGSIHIEEELRGLDTRGVRLPIQLGKAVPDPAMSYKFANDCIFTMYKLGKVSGIDVVYPASGMNERAPRSRRVAALAGLLGHWAGRRAQPTPST